MRLLKNCLLIGAVWAAFGISTIASRAGRAFGDEEPRAENAPEELLLDDPAEPLVPSQQRTHRQEERLKAVALFAAGRMKEQAQDFAGALRLYQRALRFDPNAVAVLEQIVPLAFNLDRPEEAVRYALKAVELSPSDPQLLRRLGEHLAGQGDFSKALKLYQRALALEEGGAPSADRVRLRWDMGRLSFFTEDFAAAAAAFAEVNAALDQPEQHALDDETKSAILEDATSTYTLFGEAFLKAGRPDEAIAAFQKAYAESDDKGGLGYRLAEVHASADPAKALEELDAYFQSHSISQGAAPYELLAKLLSDLGRKEELVARLEKLSAEDPENGPLGYFLAEQLRQAGKLDEAALRLTQLVEKAPSPEGYVALITVYMATKAAAPLLDALGGLAAEAGGLDSLGDDAAALAADKELVSAIIADARSRIAKAEPEAAEGGLDYGQRLAVALLAAMGKEFDIAAEFFELAIASKPDNTGELLLSWGTELITAEKYAEAAEVFRRGVDQHVLPDENPAFHFYLAGTLELAGRTDDALAVARQAVTITEDSPRLHSRVAWILYHAKRYDEALAEYSALVARFEAARSSIETSQIVRESRIVSSNICVIQNKLPQAEEWLEQVLDEYPEDVSASNDLGYLWADQGKHLDRALEMIQRAIAAEPDNIAYLDSLGWVYFRLGRFTDALPPLLKAAAGEKPDGVIMDHLGDVYHKLEKVDEAVAAWKQAVQNLDATEEAEKIAVIQKKIETRGNTEQ